MHHDHDQHAAKNIKLSGWRGRAKERLDSVSLKVLLSLIIGKLKKLK